MPSAYNRIPGVRRPVPPRANTAYVYTGGFAMLTFVENFAALTWQMVVMWLIGGALIFLAIKKEMEPALLLPMGFGAILVNLPFSGATEVLDTLYNCLLYTSDAADE